MHLTISPLKLLNQWIIFFIQDAKNRWHFIFPIGNTRMHFSLLFHTFIANPAAHKDSLSFHIEGLKAARPLSRKSNLEAKPVISDGHLKFCTTTHNLWMATVKQRSYQHLSWPSWPFRLLLQHQEEGKRPRWHFSFFFWARQDWNSHRKHQREDRTDHLW